VLTQVTVWHYSSKKEKKMFEVLCYHLFYPVFLSCVQGFTSNLENNRMHKGHTDVGYICLFYFIDRTEMVLKFILSNIFFSTSADAFFSYFPFLLLVQPLRSYLVFQSEFEESRRELEKRTMS